MILNPNKTKALVVSRSRFVNPPCGDSLLYGVSIYVGPNLDILGMKFDSRLTIEDHISQRNGILRLVKCVFVDVSLCFFIATVHLFSQSLSCVLRCWGLLQNVIFSFSSARCIQWAALPWSDFVAVVSLSSCCWTVYVVQVNLNLSHCLFSDFKSAAVRVWHTWDVAVSHPLEFEVSRCRISQFAMCFLVAQTLVWNDLPYTVFDTGMLDGFQEAVNCWLLPWVCFTVLHGTSACVVAKAIYKQFCFSHLGLCCWF